MTNHFFKHTAIIIAAAAVAMTACTREPLETPGHGEASRTIGVNVSATNGPATKSGAAGERLFNSFAIDTIGGQELRLDAYVSDYNPEVCGEETKGAITTDNITWFWMSSYAEDEWLDHTDNSTHTSGEYYEGKKVTKDGTSGKWSIADSPKWINGVNMSFWSWAGEPASNSSVPIPDLMPDNVNLTDSKASISYTNNSTFDLIYAFNRETRTFNDKGEITGGEGTYKDGSKDAMDIHFYHALAAVRFDISGLKNNGLTINKIIIDKVVNAATCEITADPATDALAFAWTPKDYPSNSARFTREFTSSDFTETGADGTTGARTPLSSNRIIFLIPQEVQGKGITLELTYTDASNNQKTSTVTLNHEEAWEPGKYYTYRLLVNESEVSVTVDDDVTPTLKSNVSIKNDGSKSAFVRASIVAYWMDSDGYFLSNCDYKTQGTIEGLATGNWSENTTDGFFYYNGEVAVGQDIGPSFLTSYAPAEAPISGATLRMIITAQAIEYDSSKTCYQAFNSNNTTK